MRGILKALKSRRESEPGPAPETGAVGIIAGNGTFPLLFADAARARGLRVIVVAHEGETEPDLASHVDLIEWIKVGQLGAMVDTFKSHRVSRVAMIGGIKRVNVFGGVKLDLRGTMLLAKLRSTKDDVIMRGIAAELEQEGIEVIPSHTYMDDYLVEEGVLSERKPSRDQWNDIEVGRQALDAMSAQDIGQLVVVKDGVITAVEAVEGSDAAIARGGELGRGESVVVKLPKKTQDLRFDVPAIGLKTIEMMIGARCQVLAVAAGATLFFEREKALALANQNQISIVGVRQ